MENYNRAIFYVNSSHGQLIVDADTGEVITYDNFEGGDDLGGIQRFNVQEYKDYYKVKMINGDLDILDIGFLELVDGVLTYIEPEQGWRDDGIESRIEDYITRTAISKFWGFVSSELSHCHVSALPPEEYTKFNQECERIIKVWYNYNKPKPTNEIKRQAAQAPAVVDLLGKALDEIKNTIDPENYPDWFLDAHKSFAAKENKS